MEYFPVMSEILTGANYGPQESLGGPYPLAHCYLGIQSHRGIDAAQNIINARIRLGTSIGGDSKFGNSAIQSGARRTISDLLGTSPSNITLTANTNEGLHIIKQGLNLNADDKVLIYAAEYIDVKTPFAVREEVSTGPQGVFFAGISDDAGRPLGFDLAQLEAELRRHEPQLLVLSHVQFPNAFVTDIQAVVALAKPYGTKVVVDVAQSFGVLPVSPEAWGCDAVVAPLWKWIGGLRGSGFLWTLPSLRAELSISRLSSSGLVNAVFTSNVETLPASVDGNRFEASTLATDAVWVTSLAMLQEKRETGICAIFERVLALQELVRVELEGSDRLERYASPNGVAGSFVSYRLKGACQGREEDVATQLRTVHNIDITARAGFLRVAAHAFNEATELKQKLVMIRDSVNAL